MVVITSRANRPSTLLLCVPDFVARFEHAVVEGKDWRAAARVVELAGLDRQGHGVPNLGAYSIGPTDPAAFEPPTGASRGASRRSSQARLDEIEAARDALLGGTAPLDRIDRMLNGGG